MMPKLRSVAIGVLAIILILGVIALMIQDLRREIHECDESRVDKPP